MTEWQEVGPALELLQFIYSSMRVVFPVDLDLGTESLHGKSPGPVTLVKRGDNPVTRQRGLCKMKVLLSLLLAAVTCMDLGEFLLGFIQTPSGDAAWWDRMCPLPFESWVSDFRQLPGKKTDCLWSFPYVQDTAGVIGIVRSGSLGSFTRQSVIKPCHSFNANSHFHFFHVRALSHSLFFLSIIFNFLHLFWYLALDVSSMQRMWELSKNVICGIYPILEMGKMGWDTAGDPGTPGLMFIIEPWNGLG